MPRARSWTDEDLRRAVAEARSYAEVMRRLQLKRCGGDSYVAVRVRIAELGLDDSHLHADRRRERAERARELRKGVSTSLKGDTRRSKRSWTDQDLTGAVERSHSYAQVLRELGLKPGGGTYVVLKRAIESLGLDTSHMTGRRTRGLKQATPASRRSLKEVLVADSDYIETHKLKLRLFREGLKERRCETCGIREWQGRPAPLQLDHVNGDRRDNRLENLRILCRNCHSQTETWCSRNRGGYGNLM